MNHVILTLAPALPAGFPSSAPQAGEFQAIGATSIRVQPQELTAIFHEISTAALEALQKRLFRDFVPPAYYVVRLRHKISPTARFAGGFHHLATILHEKWRAWSIAPEEMHHWPVTAHGRRLNP